jgi:drug/metabolite transporter (DMT)-like permease
MALHRSSGRARLGTGLAVATMLAWGVLPIPLAILLERLDPVTLTWTRFVVSSFVLAGVLAYRGRLPQLSRLQGRGWGLLAVAVLGLAGNYVLFLLGLGLTTPNNIQVLGQVSPLLLAAGGMWIYGERFERRQWLGFAVLLLGLGLFFRDQLGALVATADRYLLGAAASLGASLAWAIYGLAQKQLLVRLPSPALMLCLYIGCAGVLWPGAAPIELLSLDATGFWLLVFCSLNTVVAYGSFAASLEHLEAARVSAILALCPVATLLFVALTHALAPGLLVAEHISTVTLLGAAIVVLGSLITSLAGRR